MVLLLLSPAPLLVESGLTGSAGSHLLRRFSSSRRRLQGRRLLSGLLHLSLDLLRGHLLVGGIQRLLLRELGLPQSLAPGSLLLDLHTDTLTHSPTHNAVVGYIAIIPSARW